MTILGIAEGWQPTCPSPSADSFGDLVLLTLLCSPLSVILLVLLGILAMAVVEKLTGGE